MSNILIPLRSNTKISKVSGWQHLKKTPADELFDDSNVGLLLNQNYIIVDIDNKDNGVETWNKWIEENGEPITPTQKTPSGGLHYFFKYTPIIQSKIIKLKVDDVSVGIDILTNGSYVVVEPSKIDGKKYKFVRNLDTKLMDIPEWLLQKIIFQQKIKITKSKNNKQEIEEIPYVQQAFDISEEQVEAMLNMIDDDFCDNFLKWLSITSALKSIGLKKIWSRWSKQSAKYDKENNNSIWNSIGNPKVNINYLVTMANKCGGRFGYAESISTYTPITLTKGYAMESFESRYVPFTIYSMYDTILLKSDTGTGKTTSTATYFSKLCDKKKLLSIVSRVCLGSQQKESFLKKNVECKMYSDDDVNFSTDNLIVQLDSLIKFSGSKDFSSYIVYLDEVNSILSYLDESTTLNDKRIEVSKIFSTILNTAHKVIATDADMSDNVLRYFQLNRKGKAKILYTNEYKNYSGIPAVRYECSGEMITKMKKYISREIPFIATFDTLSQLEIIFDQVYDEKKKDKFVRHSSKHSHGNIENVTETWNGKFVFYSPQVVYGVDFVPKEEEEVFCFITGKTLNPLQIIQQIARNRKIKKLNYYCPVKPRESKYSSFDEVKEEYLKNKDAYIETFRKFCACYLNEENDIVVVNNMMMEIHYINAYFNDVLRSNFSYHFKNILKSKGFVLEDKTGGKDLTKEEIKNSKNNIKNQDDQDFERYLEGDKNAISKAAIERIDLLKLDSNKSKIKYKDEVMNGNVFDDHIKIINLLRNDDQSTNKFMDKIKKESLNKVMESSASEIMILSKIEKILDIDRLDVDMNNHKNKFTSKIDFGDSLHTCYKKSFRSTLGKPETWLEGFQLLMKGYKHVSGDLVDVTRKSMRDGKTTWKENIYKLNDEKVRHHLNLLKLRDADLKNIRKDFL